MAKRYYGRRRRKYRIHGRFILTVAIALVLLAAAIGIPIYFYRASQNDKKPDPTIPAITNTASITDATYAPPEETPEPTAIPTAEPRGTAQATIACAGDIMVHSRQLTAAKQTDGTYAFDDWFTDLDSIQRADFAMANLETTISGEDRDGYTGYPQFNSPESLIPALKNAGFDMLTTANNHSFDRKMYGVKKTIENLDAAGIMHTGTYASQEEYDQLIYVDINGINTAILAYTYGTNGMEEYVPREDLPYLIKYMEEDKILADIRRAKSEGADMVILVIHWGDEYVREPNSVQRSLAESCLIAGADIIFGSHPHVVQPVTRKKVEREDGLDREALVIYSMGNLISDQRNQYRDSGIVMNVKVNLNFDTNELTFDEVDYIPVYVNRSYSSGKYSYKIINAGEYKNDETLLNSLPSDAKSRVVAVWNEIVAHIGQEKARPLEK